MSGICPLALLKATSPVRQAALSTQPRCPNSGDCPLLLPLRGVVTAPHCCQPWVLHHPFYFLYLDPHSGHSIGVGPLLIQLSVEILSKEKNNIKVMVACLQIPTVTQDSTITTSVFPPPGFRYVYILFLLNL